MRNKGFTIVELIVVIVVVSILFGITAVAYHFWRADAAESTLKNDLQLAATAMEQERNFANTFPASMPSTYQESGNSVLSVRSATDSNFCIQGTSTLDGSLTMRFRKSEGEPRSGGC